MLSNELKKYLYERIIETMELKKFYKRKNNITFVDGLLSGFRSAFVCEINGEFMYLYDAIEELDIDAVKSLLWYQCDVRA